MTPDEKKLAAAQMGLGARLREIRQKVSRVEFAKGLEVALNSIIRYEKELRVPDADFILVICEKYGIRLDWLLKGDGPKYQAQAALAAAEIGRQIVAHYPLISWVRAGHWQEIIDNYAPGDSEAMVPSTKKFGDHTFCLRVVGDSMEPKVPEGSIIFVDPDYSANNGSLVVVRLDEEQQATFKKLVMDGDRKYLNPINPRYPVMEVNTPATICGVARRIQVPCPEPVDVE